MLLKLVSIEKGYQEQLLVLLILPNLMLARYLVGCLNPIVVDILKRRYN